MGNEMVHVNASTALEPNSLSEAMTLATKLVQSGLLGKNVTKAESALAVILTGRELGLTAMQSLRSIHVIEGKPSLSSDLMVALVKRSPKCKYFKLIESTAKAATYETDREGEGVTRMSWTIEQAASAGMAGKDNWKKYPDAMLRARCIASLARAVYPDLLAGVYEENEIVATPMPQPILRSVIASEIAKDVMAGDKQTIDAVFETAEQPTEDEQIARFVDVINGAPSLDALKQLAKDIKAQPLSESVSAAVATAYKEKRASFGEAA